MSAMVAVLRDFNQRSVVEVCRHFGVYCNPHHQGHLPLLWMTFLPDYTHSSYLGETDRRPRKTSVSLGIVKGKGKVYPRIGHEGPEGE